MTLKEVAERLREMELTERNGGLLGGLAAAIESHRCVDAESVRALAKEWDKRSDDLLVSRDKYDLGKAVVYQYAAIQIRALLPPEPDPLDEAIEAVELYRSGKERVIGADRLLVLLRKAKEQAKR